MKTRYFGQAAAVLVALGGTVLLQAASTIQFSATSYTVAENAGTVALTVQRTEDLDTVVSVDFACADGTATNGLKYTAVSGTLPFGARETNKAIVVAILNEGFVEGVQTFAVSLSSPTGGAALGTRSNATVRITDNDRGLQVEFAQYRVREDEAFVLIGVLRGDDGNFPATVKYATEDLTAKSGQDYATTAGNLEFAAGEKLKLLTIPILNDGLKEPNETFRLYLTNATGATLGSPTAATITIVDNDPGIEWEFTKYWAEESENALLIVRRGNDKELAAFSVDYQTTDVTAVAGQDYAASSGTLSFAEGEMQKTVVIPIIQDIRIEANKTIRVSLTNANGAPLGARQTTTVTILDMTGMLPHRFESISVLPDRKVQISLSGAVNPRFQSFFDLYPIEWSAKLSDWSPLVTLQRTSAATNAFLYVDSPGMETGFYRTRVANLMTPLSALNGPFAVGQVSRLLTDPTRRNRYLISTNGSLMITVVYPAQAESGARPCPLTDWGRTYISQDQAVADPAELSYIPRDISMFTHTIPGARFASGGGSCPVVVFSPGYTAPRTPQAHHLAEQLASHGYVWVSVDHADAFPTVFPDGRYIDERSATMSLAGFEDRLQDVRFILGELARWNADDPLFGGRMDLTRVAVIGFSWGAWVAAESCRIDSRCGVGVVLDGGGTASSALFAEGVQKPLLTINGSGNSDKGLFQKAVTNVVWFQVSGTTHGDFGGLSDVEVDRTCKDYILAFLDRHLRGQPCVFPLAGYPRVVNFSQK